MPSLLPLLSLSAKVKVEASEDSVAATADGSFSYAASSLINSRIVGISKNPEQCKLEN